MITRLPKEFLSVISENNGLKQYLSNLLLGHKFTPRSWLYENEQPDTILSNWMKHLDQLESGSSVDKLVYQFDTSQLEKWGPQGGVAPIDELEDVFMEGFKLGDSPRPKAFSSREWKRAKQMCQRDIRNMRLSLRPASYSHVLDDMRARDTLESNSGWPLFTRRSKPEVKDQAVQAAMDGQWKTYPAIALFRNYNKKTRLVWMYPMATNLVEGSFFQPLQSALIKRYSPTSITRFVAPWVGFEEVRALISNSYNVSGDYIAASDFSSTDAHFTHWCSEEVLDVIELAFQPQYRQELRDSVLHMHEIPLLIGPDKMVTGLHGVSSGSNWTNFIETVFDWIFGRYVQQSTNYELLYAIGDDMSWIATDYQDGFADQLEKLGESAGHQVKAEKTTNNRDSVKSLQRLFIRGYNRPDGYTRGVYSTIRALKSSVYPERFHSPKLWSSDMFCARQFMILENCVDHPLFEDFVTFVVKGQKDLIPFAQKSASALDKVTRETKFLPGLNPTYNQERRDSSLASFASIQVARML